MARKRKQIADEQGEDYLDDADLEPLFVKLMDAPAFDTAPPARRLIALLKKRGWTERERVDPAQGRGRNAG